MLYAFDFVDLSFECNDGRIHFITFQTRRVNSALELMAEKNIFAKDEVVLATGGGAHKYSEAFTKKLGVNFVRGDELTCLLKGLNFLLEHIPDECYYFSRPDLRSDETTEPFNMQVHTVCEIFGSLPASGMTII